MSRKSVAGEAQGQSSPTPGSNAKTIGGRLLNIKGYVSSRPRAHAAPQDSAVYESLDGSEYSDQTRQLQGSPAGNGHANHWLDSQEHKIFLQPSRFVHLQHGLDDFWDRLSQVAAVVGLATEKRPRSNVRSRPVSFLDTSDEALRRAGFILRIRTHLMLKYRHPDRANTAAMNVKASHRYRSQTKFEKDISYSGSVRAVYSKSTRVSLDGLPLETIEQIAQVFPTLSELGLHPGTPLEVVGGRQIQEQVHVLGQIKLGAYLKSEARVSLWYDDDTLLLAELSFNTPGENGHAAEIASHLMASLQEGAQRWAHPGANKTDWIYSGNFEANR